jgi:hypothetical protein
MRQWRLRQSFATRPGLCPARVGSRAGSSQKQVITRQTVALGGVHHELGRGRASQRSSRAKAPTKERSADTTLTQRPGRCRRRTGVYKHDRRGCAARGRRTGSQAPDRCARARRVACSRAAAHLARAHRCVQVAARFQHEPAWWPLIGGEIEITVRRGHLTARAPSPLRALRKGVRLRAATMMTRSFSRLDTVSSRRPSCSSAIQTATRRH